MASTYDSIATQTLSSAATSVTFSSIPSTFTDLVLVTSAMGDSGVIDMVLRFNSDSGTNYSSSRLYGDGTSAGSNRSINATKIDVNYSGSVSTTAPITSVITIFNYANSTTYKSVLMRSADVGGTYQGVNMIASVWRGSSNQAITSLTVSGTANIKAGSMFTLYGIKAA